VSTLAVTTQFSSPSDIVADAQGNTYVTDTGNHLIRKITPAGEVTTFAGSTRGFEDGLSTAAKFDFPVGITIDSQGNIYVADNGNHRIRKITPAGEVTTLAGSTLGYVDGLGSAARFSFPSGLATDAQGNVYVADFGNNRVRKITPAGEVTTFAGSTQGSADGLGSAARFNSLSTVATDKLGNLFVGDNGNHRIRKITPAGEVTTFAGSSRGFEDGLGTRAQFDSPRGMTLDTEGNVYVVDRTNNRIRKITPAREVTTFAGSTRGFANGLVTTALFSRPYGITTDSKGNLYV
ncbi:MAG: NHL repeat-containing protein, partial [Spirosomataceae bacterium]